MKSFAKAHYISSIITLRENTSSYFITETRNQNTILDVDIMDLSINVNTIRFRRDPAEN